MAQDPDIAAVLAAHEALYTAVRDAIADQRLTEAMIPEDWRRIIDALDQLFLAKHPDRRGPQTCAVIQ